MWSFLDKTHALDHVDGKDIYFHQCQYGTPYQKLTLVKFLGAFRPDSLGALCHPTGGGFSCGRQIHINLVSPERPQPQRLLIPTGFAAGGPWPFRPGSPPPRHRQRALLN